MRTDFFKLTYVIRLFRLRRHQRPQLLDTIAFDVKQSRALRRVEPLVQAGPEVIAAKVFLLEVKLRKRVRAVDDRFDSLRARHLAHCFHRCYLARDVHLVGHQYQPRATGNSLFKSSHDFIQVFGRDGYLD